MLKNKTILLSPILALLVVFIFSLTLFPSVQPKPTNLPIAIVNEDEGVEIPNQSKMNMGQSIVEMIEKSSENSADEEPAVHWVKVNSVEEVEEGLNEQEYYAALVIPKDFSVKQTSLRTAAPSSPEVQILINQGMNTAAATAAGQILNGVIDNMNNSARTQLLEGYTAQGATITVEQASALTEPIARNVTNVNAIGDHSANGNSPVSLFQPLWMASLATSAILFFSLRKMPVRTRKENLLWRIGQIIMGAISALVIGFGFTWIADQVVGLNIPDYLNTALFLAIAFFSFFLMISAVLWLIGVGGIAIFALMLFFGAPLLALAPEMMSPFYRDWIYSWLPMRYMVEGLRTIFFFEEGLTWSSVSTLTWIGLGSMLVILLTGLYRKPNMK